MGYCDDSGLDSDAESDCSKASSVELERLRRFTRAELHKGAQLVLQAIVQADKKGSLRTRTGRQRRWQCLSLRELCSLRGVCRAWRAALPHPRERGGNDYAFPVPLVFNKTLYIKRERDLDALADHGHTVQCISVEDNSGCQCPRCENAPWTMRNSSGWDIGYSSPDSDGNRRSYSDQESSDPGENMSVHFWSAPAPFKGLRALALESCYMDLSQLQGLEVLVLHSDMAWRHAVSAEQAVDDLGLARLPKLRVLGLGINRERGARELDVYLKMRLKQLCLYYEPRLESSSCAYVWDGYSEILAHVSALRKRRCVKAKIHFCAPFEHWDTAEVKAAGVTAHEMPYSSAFQGFVFELL